MYWKNPRKDKSPYHFKQWKELIDDILFNKLTIKEAAKKWEVTQPAISQWLRRHPTIKKFYYSRPWVERQRQLRFMTQECVDYQDVIDILEEGSDERFVSDEYFSKVAEHTATCEVCRKYQIGKRLQTGIPYRLDCPSIQDLLTYLDKNDPNIDTIVTRHLSKCLFCIEELGFLTYLLETEVYDALSLAEQERDLYPVEGWRAVLISADLLQELIDVMEGRCASPASPLMLRYCEWRKFRRSITL